MKICPTYLTRSQSVENMIYRQDYTYKGSEAVTKEINQLSKEIKQLEKEADSTVSTIKAKQAGTFSAMVDGYETVLEPAKLSGLTPAKLDELVKARQEVKEGKYLGKIITGGKWYYAVSMDVANVERMHEGMTVTVRFDNVAGEQTMKVETIGDAKGDQKQVTVVFSSTRHLAETSLLRQQSAAVIYESYRGFRVPKEALRMEGDKYYLYRVSGAQRGRWKWRSCANWMTTMWSGRASPWTRTAKRCSRAHWKKQSRFETATPSWCGG